MLPVPLIHLLKRARWHLIEKRRYAHLMDNNIPLKTNRVEIVSPRIQKQLDGFSILHLTDMHFNGTATHVARLSNEVKDLKVDLVAMTGDYHRGDKGKCDCSRLASYLETVLAGVKSQHGVFATLGNHDPDELQQHMEEIGIYVLRDQTVDIASPDIVRVKSSSGYPLPFQPEGDQPVHRFTLSPRLGASSLLRITGLDYDTCKEPQRVSAFCQASDSIFSIVLAHSPRIATTMAQAGYDFYLTGHTHGGQVRPIMGRHTIPEELKRAFGPWIEGNMIGYTSNGIGTSGIPIRVQSDAEITLFTLRRGPAIRFSVS